MAGGAKRLRKMRSQEARGDRDLTSSSCCACISGSDFVSCVTGQQKSQALAHSSQSYTVLLLVEKACLCSPIRASFTLCYGLLAFCDVSLLTRPR